MSYYKIEISKNARRDIRRIRDYLEEYGAEKIYKHIKNDISNLKYMPRAHKTLYSSYNPNGEYRRIISGKYIIIYQINKYKINILRIFNQKENYLNQKNFILKEDIQKYLIKKGSL